MANIRNQDICRRCKHKEEFPNGFPCWRCIGIDLDNDLFISEEFFVREKTTNYDLLVSESPEQLAVILANFEAKCYKRMKPSLNCAIDLYIKEKLEWLNREVDNERSDQEHEDADKR